jgi:hypothetical protein
MVKSIQTLGKEEFDALYKAVKTEFDRRVLATL